MFFILFLSPCFFITNKVFLKSPNVIVDGILVDNDHTSYRSHLSMPWHCLNMHHSLSSLTCAQRSGELEGGPPCNTLVSGNVWY